MASATSIVGNVGDDVAFNQYMNSLGVPGFQTPSVDYSYEMFAPQGRIGNNLSTAGGENEIGLHVNDAPLNTPPTSSAPLTAAEGSIQLAWGSAGFSNTLFDFELKRVGIRISFRMWTGSTTLYRAEFENANNDDVTLLGLRTRSTASATTSASRVRLTNLSLVTSYGTLSLPESAAYDTSNDGVSPVSNVVVKDILGDFALTGQTSMDWTGSALSRSAMAWQIKGFYGVPEGDVNTPEPSSMMLIGGSLAGILLTLARRRNAL